MAVRVRNTVVNGGMSGRDESIGKVFAFKIGDTKSIMKRFTAPAQPNSPKQIAIRNAFTQASAKWSLLSDAERASFANEEGVGGKENFVSTNVVLQNAGLPVLVSALPKDKVAIVSNINVAIAVGSAELTYDSDHQVPSERIQIEVSKMQSLGTASFKKGAIITQDMPNGTGSEIDFLNDLQNAIGVLTANTKVFYSVYQVTAGGGRFRLFQGSTNIQ